MTKAIKLLPGPSGQQVAQKDAPLTHAPFPCKQAHTKEAINADSE